MCVDDFDCTGNMLCTPATAGWAPPDANETFCSCDVMRSGFVKETPMSTSCDVLGPQTLYLLSFNVLVFAIGFAMQVHFTVIMVVLKRKKKIIFNHIMITLLLLNSANILELISSGSSTAQYLEPGEHIYDYNGAKRHPLFAPSFGIIILAQSVGLFAYSNLPLVWAEVVFRTRKFNSSNHSPSKLRLGVRVYQVLVLVSRLAAFGVTGKASLPFSAAIGILGLLGVLVIFVAARSWFVRLFKKVAGTNKDSSNILRRINALTDITVVGMGIATITITVYMIYIVDGALLKCEEGKICPVYLWRDACSCAVVAVKVSCQYYCALCLGFHGCSYADSKRYKSDAAVSTLNSTAKSSTKKEKTEVQSTNTSAEHLL